MSDINELNFIRITVPDMFRIIPRYLFEQIEGLDGDGIDLIYKGHFVLDPLNFFVVMSNQEDKNTIKGFFWAIVSVLEKRIVLYAVSVDKQYQKFKTELNKRVIDYLFNLPVKVEYKQIIICETARPKALEAYGWSKSKRILMEYNNVLAESTTSVPGDEQSIPSGEQVVSEMQVA